jgi:quercetin dioxygenase-like cupin family protein
VSPALAFGSAVVFVWLGMVLAISFLEALDRPRSATKGVTVQPLSLTALVEHQLEAARRAASGRSAHTVRGGRENSLHQTLLALAAGRRLDDHESPGEATLQVLQGRVRLATAEDGWEATAGDYLDIPPQRHNLTAVEDCAVLLTVLVPRDAGAGR